MFYFICPTVHTVNIAFFKTILLCMFYMKWRSVHLLLGGGQIRNVPGSTLNFAVDFFQDWILGGGLEKQLTFCHNIYIFWLIPNYFYASSNEHYFLNDGDGHVMLTLWLIFQLQGGNRAWGRTQQRRVTMAYGAVLWPGS